MLSPAVDVQSTRTHAGCPCDVFKRDGGAQSCAHILLRRKQRITSAAGRGDGAALAREDAQIAWSDALYSANRFGVGVGGTLFEGNLVAMRAEMRAGSGVLRPSGVVKIDLTP